jgi:predicted ATPase
MWLQAHSPANFARINEVLHDLFPALEQIKAIPTTDGRVYLSARENGMSRDTKVWQLSDGFLVIVALLSLIYAPKELAGSLFCIEEPENHLHPRLLETLIALLRQTQQEAEDAGLPPTQFLITTQSPYLINQFTLDEIVWVEKAKGETKTYRPSDKTYLKKLVEDKDLGIADLMLTGVLGADK